MALQIQLRRGTTTEHSSFTGAMGEVTVDTSKNTLVLHDGTTVGGFPLTRSGEIVDNLTTDVSNKPLSAKQGKVLNESKVSKGVVREHFGSQNSVIAPSGFNFHNMLVGDYVFKDLTVTTSPLNAPPFDYATVYCENTITGSSTNGKLLTAKEYSTGKVATKAFRNGVWSGWNTVPFEKDVLGGTYKNVTSTRLSNVTYTNTSGKTIVICVIISNNNMTFAPIASGLVDNNLVALVTGSEGNSLSFSMVVPNNSTYTYYYDTRTDVDHTVMELS